MPDILDAAQKQINDAANKLTPPSAAGSAPPPADPTPPTPPPPPDPAPAPPPATPPMPAPEPAKPPEPVASEPTPEESAFVDKLIHETGTVSAPAAAEPPAPEPPSPEPIPPAETPPVPPAPPLKPKKKGAGRGAMIAAILLLLFALPMGVFFVSQQQNQLTEQRSRAAETCISALECNDTGNNCSGCTGSWQYRPSGRKCCREIAAPTSTTRPSPTPTRAPTPTSTSCGSQGQAPVNNRCCSGLEVVDGICGVRGAKCPNSNRYAPDGDICNCTPKPQQCVPTPTPTSATTPNPRANGCLAGELRHDSPSRDVAEEDCRDRCNVNSCVGLINQGGSFNPQSPSLGFFWCYKCQGTGGGIISTPIPTRTPSSGGQCPSTTIAENCAIYECPGGCSFYGGSLPECRTFAKKVPCSQAAASGCGQVDYLDDNGNYCGVKPGTQCTNGTNSCGGGGEPTPTTPPQVLQCRAISIYKDGAKVTDYATLKAGDAVVLAVKGDNATKGRFRVNGAPPTFEESTGTNANGEFTFPFTIPGGVPNNSITIEAEVFQNGVWK